MTEKIPGRKNYSPCCEWCTVSATVIKMLRISVRPFVDDGCCLRTWPLRCILPTACSFVNAQSNIEWLRKMDEKKKICWVQASASGQSKSIKHYITQLEHKERKLQKFNIPTFKFFFFFCKNFCLRQHVLSVIKRKLFLGVPEGSGVFSSVQL